jgi:hypothetical protein
MAARSNGGWRQDRSRCGLGGRAMAKKDDKGRPAPICSECGGRMTHYATLPKTYERPPLIIYRCDHCGAISTVAAQQG